MACWPVGLDKRRDENIATIVPEHWGHACSEYETLAVRRPRERANRGVPRNGSLATARGEFPNGEAAFLLITGGRGVNPGEALDPARSERPRAPVIVEKHCAAG